MKNKIRYIVTNLVPLIFNISNWLDITKVITNPGHDVVIKTKKGIVFKVRHLLDVLVIKESFLDNDYQVNLKDPKLIIDIGANIGDFTLLCSYKYPKAKILAFEPAAKTLELLKYNLKANNAKNVKVFKKAVSGKNGKVTFYTYQASGLSSFYQKRSGGQKENVITITLADVFQLENIKKCDFLKMDCEGSEFEILLNSKKSVLKKIDKMAIEYHDSLTSYKHTRVTKLLKVNGFKIKIKKHPIEKDIGLIFASR